MKHVFAAFAGTLVLFTAPQLGLAHCEVPCGIYGDKARIHTLYEHTRTINKAISQIHSLTGNDAQSLNQKVRWINNKESHATEVQQIVSQYFMTQRIKPAQSKAGMAKYVLQITTLHKMLRAAMSCKQKTTGAAPQELKQLIDQFAQSYFSKADLEHIRSHHKGK